MNQVFDFRRLNHLARRDFINDWRGLAVASGAVGGTLFVGSMIEAFFDRQAVADYSSFLTGTLVIWGIIAASLVFKDLHDKNKNEYYLLLPASTVEKTLVGLLNVSVFLPLYILVLITMTSLISEGAKAIFFKTGFTPLNPVLGDHFKVIGYLIIAQSVFFLGAAWFRKAHLVKTVLSLILFSIALGFIGAFAFRIIFASYFEGFFNPVMTDFNPEDLINVQFPFLLKTLGIIGKVTFYGLLAPFCWVVAWLRVKETQSCDGV